MLLLDWYAVTVNALFDLWGSFLNFIPELVGALLVFTIGWLISAGFGKLIADILKRLRFNQIFERGNWKSALDKAEIKVDPAGFIGSIVKWVLVIVFLAAAVEILGLDQFAIFLQDVLAYLPNVIVAALIFAVAVIIADIVEKVMRATVESAQFSHGAVVGAVVKWSIWTFAIIAMLTQLGVATALLQILFSGLVALFVIAGGIAFGLGGKDTAAMLLQDLVRKFKG